MLCRLYLFWEVWGLGGIEETNFVKFKLDVLITCIFRSVLTHWDSQIILLSKISVGFIATSKNHHVNCRRRHHWFDFPFLKFYLQNNLGTLLLKFLAWMIPNYLHFISQSFQSISDNSFWTCFSHSIHWSILINLNPFVTWSCPELLLNVFIVVLCAQSNCLIRRANGKGFVTHFVLINYM